MCVYFVCVYVRVCNLCVYVYMHTLCVGVLCMYTFALCVLCVCAQMVTTPVKLKDACSLEEKI